MVYGVKIRGGGVTKTSFPGVSLRVDVSLPCDLRYISRFFTDISVPPPVPRESLSPPLQLQVPPPPVSPDSEASSTPPQLPLPAARDLTICTQVIDFETAFFGSGLKDRLLRTKFSRWIFG